MARLYMGMTTTHPVATRDEWLTARLTLLDAEKDLTRRNDELARQRQRSVGGGRDGLPVRQRRRRGLARRPLPRPVAAPRATTSCSPRDGGPGCPSCSSSADSFDGIRVHLENHDVALVAVSRAPARRHRQAYRRRMGWTFPWASSEGSELQRRLRGHFTEEQLAWRGAELQDVEDRPGVPRPAARRPAVDEAESPGMSAFVIEDGVVYHTYSAYARGLDALWGMWQWLDRAPKGRNDGSGGWYRRHDEYPRG